MTTWVSVGGGTLLSLAIVLSSKPLLGSLGSEFAAQPYLLLVLVLAAWMACWSQGAIAALSMSGGERPLAAAVDMPHDLVSDAHVLGRANGWRDRCGERRRAECRALANGPVDAVLFVAPVDTRWRATLANDGSSPD